MSTSPGPGMLLVATPELLDENFAGSVVLLLDADDDGALGVVINRPTPVPLAELLDVWAQFAAQPEVLFQGGPVSAEGALAVAELTGPVPGPSIHPVTEQLGLVDLDAGPEDVDASIGRLRVFAGYAGWGAGQLEGEIDSGHWYAVAGTTADVFTDRAEDLWRTVLRRQPGNLALHSTRPVDVDLN